MSTIIISPDDIKETLPNYNSAKSHLFHSRSVKIADQQYKKALNRPSSPSQVILMCGGSASGKSEYIEKSLSNIPAIIYDGTLSTIEGAKVKIRNAQKKRKVVKVTMIITDSIQKSFHAFLYRKRKYPYQRFIETHINSRETIKFLHENINNIEIELIESYIGEDEKLKFRHLSHIQLDSYLNLIQISEDEIYNMIKPEL